MSAPVTRLYNWVNDKNASIKITASRMDAEFDQIVAALNQKAVIKATAPDNPINGMLWYDSTNSLLKCYIGTSWGIIDVMAKGADVASGATVTLGNDGSFFDITGTTNITSITAKAAGKVVYLQFDGVLTVTDGSNLKLDGNFVTAAGSTLMLISDGTNWWEISRSPTTPPDASETVKGIAELATSAEAIAGTDDSRIITPLKLRNGLNAGGTAPIYACRAWCKFNGTGTQAIISSGNVSSVTDNANGDSTITFTTAMPDANYIAVFGGQSDGDLTHFIGVQCKSTYATPQTGSLRIRFIDSLGQEALDVYCAIFR